MMSYTHENLEIPDDFLDIIDTALISYPNFLLEIKGINGKKIYQLDDEFSAQIAMEIYSSLTSLSN